MYTFFPEHLKRNDHLEKSTCRWEDNIKTVLREEVESVRTGFMWFRIKSISAGCGEHCEFHDQLSDR
jgi:hypothetical protein